MSKYRNIKAEVDGIRFDSLKEARRYQELKLMERAGEIKDLQLQVKYVLVPTQKIEGKVVERELSYRADFVYFNNEIRQTVVEDVKGVKTKEYRIKKKLMLYLLGIQISEV